MRERLLDVVETKQFCINFQTILQDLSYGVHKLLKWFFILISVEGRIYHSCLYIGFSKINSRKVKALNSVSACYVQFSGSTKLHDVAQIPGSINTNSSHWSFIWGHFTDRETRIILTIIFKLITNFWGMVILSKKALASTNVW